MTAAEKKGIIRSAGSAYVWSIAGDWSEVKENAGKLRARLHELRNRRYREETFDDAVKRLDITKERLHQRHDQLLGLSIIYALICIVVFGFLCATQFSPHPINHALMSIGVMLLAGSKFITARFRVAQIRSGQLFGFKEWLLRGVAK